MIPLGYRMDVPGFAPNRIATAAALTNFDVSGVLAIRISADSEYYLNADSANKATMPGGSVTVFPNSVTTIQFTAETVVEVMDAGA